MSCGTGNPLSTYTVQYFYNPNCTDCADCGNNVYNASCVIYTGPNLACSGVETNDSLETALEKIDTQICSAIGDYSTYQFNCLPAWYESAIIQESQFVDAITGYACEIFDTLEEFTDVTFPAYQTTVDSRFDAIEVPEITCAVASVDDEDTLQEIFTKYCTTLTTLNTAIDISDVVWNSCFTVPSTPDTIAEGFTLLIDQICQVEALATTGSLPTFNNSANCLDGGADDSLVTTVGLITTRLCTTPTFDINALSWGCLTQPSIVDTNLQAAFQTVLTQVSSLIENVPTWSDDFVVTANDEEDVCAGVTISLATPIDLDRFVAVDDDDVSPGTLVDKITAGTGITLDTLTTPGTMIIESDGTADSFEVLADTDDETPGFLSDKIAGGTNNGITISPTYNSGTENLDITPSVDRSVLFTALLEQLDNDPVLYELFCLKVANCPSTCLPPTNVQASTVLLTTTTTTTLP